MARFLLILFLFAPVKLQAGKHLFLLIQKEETFQADANLWATFFQNNCGNIQVTRPHEYSTIEVVSIFNDYRVRLASKDTLIIVVSAHTVRYGNCTLLQYPGGSDIFDVVVFKNTYETFLEELSRKGVRVLLIVNSCEPFTVITPTLTFKIRGLTIVYSDEDYSIFNENSGSLLAILIYQHRFLNMKTCIEWVNERFLDKSIYYGVDKTLNTPISDNYPQKTTIYGPDYTF